MRRDTSFATTEGTRVAVYDQRTIDGASATVRTVVRVTATQIILDNGTRWRRSDGNPVGYQYTGGFHGPPELRPVSDPQVVGALARSAVLVAVERIKGVYTSRHIQGLATAAGALEDIETAVDRLRADLDQLRRITATPTTTE